MFVFEAAIREASRVSGIPVEVLQDKNLLETGDPFSYGQNAENALARRCWDETFAEYGIAERIEEIRAEQALEKTMVQNRFGRGYALMPVCFGISFTATFMNQARALIHVYTDGSVGVSTGAIEMGQGVNQKIRDIVAESLGLPLSKIKLETTNTTRISNTSPTAASSGSDLNGAAALMACEMIKERLLAYKAEQLGLPAEELSVQEEKILHRGTDLEISWSALIWEAYTNRIHLSAEAHFSTPNLHFDKTTEKGRPFAYHAYGTAYIEATVDRLLGTYWVDKALVVHDLGRSINPLVDLGQVEGGMAQGIGWMTMEDMQYAPNGRPLTATAGTYKLPDIWSAPQDMQVKFLEGVSNPEAVRGSKAVGEPPFMYGIGAYFAIEMAAGREGAPYHAPITPERLFMEIRQDQKASS
jgi:xanthine dehydrogenase large subunit